MRFERLEDWLDWQQGLHPSAIDLGLERVRQVAERLGVLTPGVPVITVAGTNGKGSCVAYLDAVLRRAGYRTGVYTSPHLLRYNERVRINGQDIDDASLVDAFGRIDRARGDLTLTYFEFGTLAALDLFRRRQADVWVLEVGLGGRLDAVNIVDADCAIITSIGLDHTDWLGSDRNAIGREKAGILRSGRPVVYGEADVPESVARYAAELGAELLIAQRDYRWQLEDDAWSLEDAAGRLEHLPRPGVQGRHQHANAAAAAVALRKLAPRLPVPEQALREGIAAARVQGRLEVVPGEVEWVLDVAHNHDSVTDLDAFLAAQPPRRTLAVFAQMQRKALEEVVPAIEARIDQWYLLDLPDSDARATSDVARYLSARGAEVADSGPSASLWTRLESAMQPGDRVVVFGSFRTVEEAMRQGYGSRGDAGRGM